MVRSMSAIKTTLHIVLYTHFFSAFCSLYIFIHHVRCAHIYILCRGPDLGRGCCSRESKVIAHNPVWWVGGGGGVHRIDSLDPPLPSAKSKALPHHTRPSPHHTAPPPPFFWTEGRKPTMRKPELVFCNIVKVKVLFGNLKFPRKLEVDVSRLTGLYLPVLNSRWAGLASIF